MAHVLVNNARVTTDTTGTGTMTLGSAVSGFEDFAGVGNTNTTSYYIQDGSNWESGKGTYSTTGPTLTRDTIYESSNSDAAINLSGSAVVSGVVTVADIQTDVEITGGSITGITDLAVADGGTGASSASAAATNLGLGTGDSPQFTGVNVGHATDTTVTRASAGDINVEGNIVYRAGGTDVPVTDGGTGASTAGAAATNLGLGTGDSPQFTAVNIGHATDTTLSRASAGDVNVEGNIVYRAGGTDVPVTDGGTGSSTASGARTNLGVAIGSDVQAYSANLGDNLGQQTIWVPAIAMRPTTTNGAASGSSELATNDVMMETYDFDTSTEEHVQFGIQMPKGWDESTLIAQFVWSHPSTATNFGVAWGIQAVAFADGDALDTAFGTEVVSTDTGGTTDDCFISPETTAITVAGTPGAEEYVIFQVSRVVANGSDNMAVDARLHGVKIHYTTNAARDD